MEYDSFVYSFGPKYIIARIVYMNNKIIKFQNSLIMKHYKVKKYNYSEEDFGLLLFFIILFVITAYKEVFLWDVL